LLNSLGVLNQQSYKGFIIIVNWAVNRCLYLDVEEAQYCPHSRITALLTFDLLGVQQKGTGP
jgi:hypothetical protein